MSRPSLDQYYLAMLALVAGRSTCPRRAVGAIVVDEKGVILGTGYNGPPRGLAHCGHPGSSCEAAADPKGDTSRCWAAHAEVNALLQCGGDLDRAHTIYCSAAPCFACAKYLVNVGVKRVVAEQAYAEDGPATGWAVLRAARVILQIGDAA